MIPTKDINPEINTSDTINPFEAYTFLDSYLHMKGGKHDVKYAQSKELLTIEKEAISSKSVDILYHAATAQAKNLSTLIMQVRNFTQGIRNDVIQNLNMLIPDPSEIDDFEEALRMANIPKQKMITYAIMPNEYPNMASFYSLFKREIAEFSKINNDQTSITDPFVHNPATANLIKAASLVKASSSVEMLKTESCQLTEVKDLVAIKAYFIKKSMILSNVNLDFRTFYFYLRQFRFIDKINKLMKPTVMDDGRILVGESKNPLNSFADYLVLYKHYSTMIKYFIDIIAYYDSRFFNKIYAIQANIECFRSIMDFTVSWYRSKMRNSINNENFNNTTDLIGRIDTGNMLLSDSTEITYPVDTIHKMDTENHVYDEPEDSFDYEYDVNDNIDSVISDNHIDNNELNGTYKPMYYHSAIDSIHELDTSVDVINNIYECASPKELRYPSRKKALLEEASDAKVDIKANLEKMRDAIKNASAQFRDSIKTIREEYALALEKVQGADLSTLDLSGIHFDCFSVSKGVLFMNKIRIPSYHENDMDLLLEDNAVSYKQKYFKDCYYFHYKEVPVNRNKFRGSQIKRTIEEKDIPEAVSFFLNYIEEYPNIVSKICAGNTRICKSVEQLIENVDTSYGEDETVTEAIILNRSIFRDELYKILLEAEGETDEAPEENPGEELETPNEEPTEELEVDDTAAADANDAQSNGDAIKTYIRIAYEINSARMDVYEEIYETGFKLIKLVAEIIN